MTQKTRNEKKKKAALILLLLLLCGAAAFYLSRRPGGPETVTIQKGDDGWRMYVDGEPYFVKGVCYSPVPVGKDYEHNFWGDPAQPWVTDGKLMKQMGVNTVRFYKAGKNPEEVRHVISDLHRKFGIRTAMGTYLGFWDWPPPNYADADFREKVKTETLEMVRLYKDTPGLLVWVLGNENNYSFDLSPAVNRWTTDAIDALPTEEEQRLEKAKIYYSFVNEIAREIKKIDPNHPVVMSVGEVKSLDIAGKYAKDVDALGMIAYRGPSFGNLFRQVKQKFDKPILMTEYGADSFNALKRAPDEKSQAEFLKLQWRDIERNAAGGKGEDNSLGGLVFEWNDEWWKGNENLPHTWSVHEEAGQSGNASYYYDAEVKDRQNINEEWFGIVSLEPKEGDTGLDKRVPKKAYETLKQAWTAEGK